MRPTRSLRARVFALTWISYASFYLTRKNVSVVKATLEEEGVSLGALASMDTAYLVLYAAGQIISGALGDRFGARRVLAVGMLASAACAVVFGSADSALVMAGAFGVQGLCQSTGWPNNIKAIAPFFREDERGKVMGFWCTCYQVGGIASTALAAMLLVRYGFGAVFFVPAAWVALVGIAIAFLLPTRDIQPEANTEVETKRRRPMLALLRAPAVWSYGGCYFGLKLIRYSLLFWLPYYLSTQLGYADDDAGYLSTAFEVGGIAGAIVTGLVADRFFPTAKARLLVPMIALLAIVLVAFGELQHGPVTLTIAIALIGLLIVGPEALITAAVPQDLGGRDGVGSAAGLINGMGSIGAMLQGAVTVGVSEAYGWDAVFTLFIAVAVVSACALLPLALKTRA